MKRGRKKSLCCRFWVCVLCGNRKRRRLCLCVLSAGRKTMNEPLNVMRRVREEQVRATRCAAVAWELLHTLSLACRHCAHPPPRASGPCPCRASTATALSLSFLLSCELTM